MSRTDRIVSSRNLHSPHPPEAYPGMLAVRPGPLWTVTVLVPKDGETLVALGGEHNYGYETPGGARAEALHLSRGDRATIVRGDLPGSLAEWHVERVGGAGEVF